MDTSRFFGGITSLARPIVPSLPSNRLALTGAVAFTLVGTLLTLLRTDTGLVAAVGAGVGYGIGAFLSWATARELDPDRPRSARFAVLAYGVVAFTGPPELLAVTAVMVTVRILSRSTGQALTPVDLAAMVVLAGLAARSSAGFVAGSALAAALWLDTRLVGEPGPEGRAATRQLGAAGLAFGAAFAVTLLSGAFLSGWRGPSPLEGVLTVAAAVAATRLRPGHPASTADLTGVPLDPVRVRRGQQVAVAVLVLGIPWTGFAAVPALGPLLASLIGVGAVGWRRPARVGT